MEQSSKLTSFCNELGIITANVSSVTSEHICVQIARAIALLLAYDDLAEYVQHSYVSCPAKLAAEGHPLDMTECDCGLEDAQRVVADLLEGV